VKGSLLDRGKTRSCGCLHREELATRMLRHGRTGDPTWLSWRSLGRHARAGVDVWPAWLESFEQFFKDMGERPPGRKLGRLDPQRGYEPANCAWFDDRALTAARKSTELHEWRGRMLSVPAIAGMEGLPVASLKRNMERCASPEEAVARTRENMTTLHEWRGRPRSIRAIAKLENVPASSLADAVRRMEDIGKAVEAARAKRGTRGTRKRSG
jgi:hypothetical protein